MKRTIIIGDVHGCSEELEDLLQKVNPAASDRIIFVGDLINRGPDTRKVLDIAKSLDNAEFVLGNHEYRLLRYKEDETSVRLKSFEEETLGVLEDSDWGFFKKMKPYVYLEEYETVVVHGGFLPDVPWREQELDVMVKVQVVDSQGKPAKRSDSPDSPLWSDLWQGPPFVVYGHTPSPEVERSTWSLGIDTACVFGHKLTAYILPTKELVQVDAYKAYRY